ncbi:MAG: toprim domain-containing protein [Microthrixaceae bacterium]
MRAEGVSFRHAVELLRDGFGPTRLVAAGGGVVRPPERSSVVKLDGEFSAGLSDRELLDRVVGFYTATLRESPDALEFLRRRRCGSTEAIERFRLGYANRTLGYRIPAANRAEGRELRRRLQALGFLRESGHEHLRGSLVVPISDATGTVVEAYGRKIGSGLRRGTPLHCYLPGPHAGVWNLDAFAAAEEVIVCESLIDALSFWCAGFRNVTAAYGTNGWTPDHHQALVEHGIGRVLVAFDNDPAGNRAAAKLAEGLMAGGVECFRVGFPDGADANDVAMSAESATDVLGEAIRHATWMGKAPGPATRGEAGPLGEPAPPGPAPVAPPSIVDEHRDDDDGGPEPAAPESVREMPDASPPAAASPVPDGPAADVAPSVEGDEMVVVFGERRWRVRGLAKNSSFDVLRVNVLVSIVGSDGFHVDTLDLYAARARTAFITAAAAELRLGEDVVKRDLGRVLLAAEDLVEEAIRQAQEPASTVVELDADERAAALELLTSADLVDRIVGDFARVGVVGEATNLLVGYLAATSRLLDRPLAVIVQSTSAAGKSQLMDAVLSFMPGEDLVRFSAMTGQSLYYLGERDLAHKVLAIAEEEGAERAAYALKILQSEGELSIASTGKDNASGRLVTHEYRVQGPTGIFLTTTAIDVDEELLNRCVVLSVDEDRTQTRAIHQRQRQAHTFDGLVARERAAPVLALHRNAQRLLEPVAVVNPYADRLGFADAATRTRRDHVKYLTLISTVALLHQHQRPKRTTVVDGQTVSYIEATPADIALANRLAHEALGRSLDDLPPQTRRLLGLIHDHVHHLAEEQAMAPGDVRLTRRQFRDALGWGDTQLKVHLARLVDLEHVHATRPTPTAAFVYQLVVDAHPDAHQGRRLAGLVDPDTLDDSPSRACRSGPEPSRSGGGRPPVGGRSGPGRLSSDGTDAQVNGHEPAPGAVDGPDSAVPGDEHGGVVVAAGVVEVGRAG